MTDDYEVTKLQHKLRDDEGDDHGQESIVCKSGRAGVAGVLLLEFLS
jgi:hypothetical protein